MYQKLQELFMKFTSFKFDKILSSYDYQHKLRNIKTIIESNKMTAILEQLRFK